MKTNSPTHDEIAQRAHELWDSRGNPNGCDEEIWFEAERQLKAASPEANGSGSVRSDPSHGRSEPTAGHLPRSAAPAPSPDDAAAKAALQRNAARAPQLQHGKNAPKPAPAESGKPLWDKPHSS